MPKEVNSGQDASKTKHNTSKNETNGSTVPAGVPNGNDAGVGSVAGVQNATDESSELSDLGDDSEAETDQMDFLEDGDDLNKKLDLRALSDLTQLARLQGVDSDEEDVKKLEEPHLGDEQALSLNPKDNEEANREIMKDIDAIHEELGQPTPLLRPESKVESLSESTESRPEPAKKRKVSDEERSRKKQKSEVEPDVKNEESENVDEETDQIDSKVKPEDEPLDSVVHETVEETAEEAEAEAEDDEGDEEEADEADEPGARAEEANSDEEGAEDEEEDEEEDADMSEKRQAAVAELIEIEKAFASLRDKMYHDKLNLLEHELQLCVEGSHPELSKIYYKINAFHQDALRQANSNLSYRLKCIDRETVACRTAVHQNFLKQVYDSKSEMITNTTSMWYKINRERNQLDQLVPDYSYSASGGAFVSNDGNDDGSTALPQSVLYELVSQRNAINHQLGILNGLVEFSGIPAAVGSSLGDEQQVPELLLRKASEEEIADDLRAMGVMS